MIEYWSVNGNILVLIDDINLISEIPNPKIRSYDSIILYSDKSNGIQIYEKDGSQSNMCGNSLILLARKYGLEEISGIGLITDESFSGFYCQCQNHIGKMQNT